MFSIILLYNLFSTNMDYFTFVAKNYFELAYIDLLLCSKERLMLYTLRQLFSTWAIFMNNIYFFLFIRAEILPAMEEFSQNFLFIQL